MPREFFVFEVVDFLFFFVFGAMSTTLEIPTTPQIYYPILGYVKAELIINCIIVFIVLCVVSLRVVGRFMGPGIGWDDAFVIFATVCSAFDLVPLNADQEVAFGRSNVVLSRSL